MALIFHTFLLDFGYEPVQSDEIPLQQSDDDFHEVSSCSGSKFCGPELFLHCAVEAAAPSLSIMKN